MFGLFSRDKLPDPAQTYVICGLGNPGKSYEKNRHNVGFRAIEALAERFDLKFRRKWKAEVAEFDYEGKHLILLKPQTYMNLSGEALKKCCRKNKIPAAQVLVIYDDMSLANGRLRIRYGGGSAGHNGIKSILSSFGGADFGRVRIGISHPGKGADVADYVLSDFTKAEMALISPAATAAAEAALMLCTQGYEAAMNAYNGTVPGASSQPNQDTET